jgi:hypothetical protein
MTLSSVIYYTGIDPLTGEHFEVVRDIMNAQAASGVHEPITAKLL